jgi:hypothetical protein
MGEGVGFDFHDAHKTEKGRAIAAKLLTGFTPKITATLPNEFLDQIMGSGIQGNAYMRRRESTTAATFDHEATSEIKNKGYIALTELGVYAVKHCLDAVLTAWNFAQKDTEIVLSTEVLKNI